MTRFRVAVVDDEPLARHMVAAILREDEEVDAVFECADAAAAQGVIREKHPDIVFLDIEMPAVTGLDLARELGEDGPVVVFVTAFNRYAPDAFEVSASDYVLKPFSDQRFNDALQRAKKRVRERRLGSLAHQLATLSSELRLEDEPQTLPKESTYIDRLTFKHNDRVMLVKTAEVSWIEAEDYYVRIHSDRGDTWCAPRLRRSRRASTLAISCGSIAVPSSTFGGSLKSGTPQWFSPMARRFR